MCHLLSVLQGILQKVLKVVRLHLRHSEAVADATQPNKASWRGTCMAELPQTGAMPALPLCCPWNCNTWWMQLLWGWGKCYKWWHCTKQQFRLQQCGVFFTDVENKQQIQPKDSEVENSLFSLVLLWNVKANFWSCISEGRRGKLKEGNVCCQQWAWGKASWFGLQLSSLLESCEIAVHAAWACCNTGKMNVLVICKQMHINFYLCISPVLCIVYLHTEIC